MASASDPASRHLLNNDAPSPLESPAKDAPAIAQMEREPFKPNTVSSTAAESAAPPFAMVDYAAFLALGMAMLWPWNCFLSAAAYFQDRFEERPYLRDNFLSFVMTTSTITSTAFMFILSHRQKSARYTFRIWCAQIINITDFTLLAVASLAGTSFALTPYFVYLMISVFFSALATSLSQNGAFAIANLFTPLYTQAIMVGQAIAGVLPSIAQILTVVSVESTISDSGGQATSSLSSFIYFLTATGVIVVAFLLYMSFYRRHRAILGHAVFPVDTANDFEANFDPIPQHHARKHVPLLLLLRKLYYSAFAVAFTFLVTMLFPVFAGNTLSVNYVEGVSSAASWLRPNVFIPLAFLIWNLGDLFGRLICGSPKYLIRSPPKLAVIALARALFIPLFLGCNIHGNGSVINSDFVYMMLQLLFGISNGYVASCTMMGAEFFVEQDEREATGGFMGLALNVGLAGGSISSFVLVAIIS
ncbi:nucleoside transporter-domain-containing protein [Limtongia smithiae]|uniref:nucleoside transporter-domain-containing protein n=1 Tax=Limtongia smithiae TaxID=1125753 RepID=UPI0034CE8876